MKVTASIVLYNSNPNEIEKLCLNIFEYFDTILLHLIDNSPNNQLKFLENLSKNINYIHLPNNPGFGSAHNVAMQKAIDIDSKYHFVINPDIILIEDVFTPMLKYMENNIKIAMMMPKILNLDLSKQYLPKLLPTPIDLFLRKIKKPAFLYVKFINQYELRFVDDKRIYEAPVLSGCFTLFRTSVLKEKGLYDDGFFMYFEDWDISRRIHSDYKTIIFQKVSVIHEYESGANKNKKLFKIFIKSAVRYFNKWGWFFDKERKGINKKTLQQF
ncbi:hypothetical protein CHRY9390_02322 [Chryseobacterium aquaeductus]|uniref:Glycosyltransferase 2-like domain-containing protein n=1 Tax=Chryseobacterium aquaeductus TaxID=2675056 RepID=A0A9N8MH02_9FLAO|nr:glycosyltransferase family 2 protein [Chryseobacterium aquaeductus]CAA7331609.1 hypothetical protein CHRY9390_02322 [Chryseobacterium potabilaquae]CAD7811230.1 hypothetical protein CHRY9390_02322 [Chryseobacterium aquaeductus]